MRKGTQHSEETIIKMRSSHAGKKCSTSTKEKLRSIAKKKGYRPPSRLGKRLAQEKRDRMCVSHALAMTLEVREKISVALKKRGISPPHRPSQDLSPYPKEFNALYKERIRQRDAYLCQLCGKPQERIKLSVHHIDGDKRNMDPSMKISLHVSCHMKTESGDRIAYRLYFEDLQKSRGLL